MELWECQHHLAGDGSGNPPKIRAGAAGFSLWMEIPAVGNGKTPLEPELGHPKFAFHGSSNPFFAACRLGEAEQDSVHPVCTLLELLLFVFPNLPFPCLSRARHRGLIWTFFRQKPAQHLWVGAAILEHLEVNLISTFGKLCSKLQC